MEELLQGALKWPMASAFNPLIVGENGHGFVRRGSCLISRKQRQKPKEPLSDDFPLQILSGAALFCRKQHFDSVGGFDEKIFLYHEDDDISIRLKQQIGPLMHIGSARVMHHGGQSSKGSQETDYARLKLYATSRLYVMRKHAIAFARVRFLIEAFARLLKLKNWCSAETLKHQIRYFVAAVAALRRIKA